MNAGYYFYTEGYSGFDLSNPKELKFDEFNEKLLNFKINKHLLDNIYSEPMDSIINSSFELTTLYPGLLIGSGYHHGIENDNDFKIGFYFDYTGGIPVIPGSSVKGILRSAFKLDKHKKDDEIDKSRSEKKYAQKKEYLANKIVEIKKIGYVKDDIKDDIKEAIPKLEEIVFEGKIDNKQLPIYERAVFFDAIPIVQGKNESIQLFYDDYITPHPTEFSTPKPIRFLKIKPDVRFQFRFKINDIKINLNEEKTLLLSSSELELLFLHIICDFGAGAKTNVGYGRFDKEMGIKALEESRKKREEKLIEAMSPNERLKFQTKQKVDFLLGANRLSELETYLLSNLYTGIDNFEDDMKLFAAKTLKDFWVHSKKWEEKGLNEKQLSKVKKIKQILSE